MLEIHAIGTHARIPGWPEVGTIAGLIDALARWQLDPRWNYADDPQFEPHPLRAPFRGPAVRSGGARYDFERQRTVYLMGAPIYPNAPGAVTYCGNFQGYSFGFNLDTDDADLIEQLDAAISYNLAGWRG